MSVSLRKTPALLAITEQLLAHHGPVWGLRLVKESGFPTGTVYPLLERLERAGHLSSSWDDDPTRRGPRRRLYTLTPSGHAWAVQLHSPTQVAHTRPIGKVALA